MFLAGDIGGTKTILALYKKEDIDFNSIKKETFISKDFADLETILSKFLSENPPTLAGACFGIAGAVIEGIVKTPNLPWVINQSNLQKKLKTEKTFLINDLLANAYGIKTLSPSDFFVINKGVKQEKNNQAIVSAGTGLGEAGLVFTDNGHVPFASEGGHASFTCIDEESVELFLYLKKKYKDHLSVERVLSGVGLENIYHFMVEVKKEKKLEAGEEKGESLAAAISSNALKGKNQACIKALDLFVKIYGTEAGDLALKFLATGGVFIGGGIAPKILEALKKEVFMKAFCQKGRLKPLLEQIPVNVILNQETALRGAAYFIKKQLVI